MAAAVAVESKLPSCVCMEDVTPSRYPISVDVTFPILVVAGRVTIPVNVGAANKATRVLSICVAGTYPEAFNVATPSATPFVFIGI